MREQKMPKINKDCKYFKGSKPCIWNKTKGYECAMCTEHRPRGKSVLIIKLDSIGDVLRSTCVIPKIKEKFPVSYLTWVTMPESIEFIESNPDIDEAWEYHELKTMTRLLVEEWDIVYNLDNSHKSCSLAALAKAKEKIGFVLTDKVITPTNDEAMYWLRARLFVGIFGGLVSRMLSIWF